MFSKRWFLALLVVFVAVPLNAATARQGWTKVELTHAPGGTGPFPADLLTRFGAEAVADYGEFSIVYVPQGLVRALTEQAARENVRVRVRDDLDVLYLPGATVDVRQGIVDAPPQKLIREYPRGKPGLFVLQFTAPLRNEWVAELEGLGWTLSRYIPNDGYLVIGTPELTVQTRRLPFVQWIDFFHPYQKAAVLAGDVAEHDQLFELSAGAASISGVEAIRAAAHGEIVVHNGSLDTLVTARMTDAAAEELLRHELIISVSPKPLIGLSDERQSMSLTSNLNAAQSQPTSPGQYWSWVTAHCPDCTNMPATTWRVGIADTGLDDGGNNGHPDLNGRKYFGARVYGTGAPGDDDPQCVPTQLLCDAVGHGTVVAGIAAGNPATGAVDDGGYALGQGVASTAGVFVTKILSTHSSADLNRFFEYTRDPANNGVTIQNHSFNEYSASPDSSGLYSTLARWYDIATRDADDSLSAARIPLLISVSAGNHDQGWQDQYRYLVLPGGTAKNVLSMGGLENYRQNVTQCRGTHGDSFRNVMRTSRLGTRMAAGYIKPDLMAPASLIVSTHTFAPTPYSFCFGAFGGDDRYTGDSGTSFAAPVAASAGLIVKRYLGSTPAATSPALTKAVLIAGARSVRGGEDRTHDPVITTVAAVPSVQQGFGRVSLEDILNGAQKPVVFEQSSSARLFTQTGQVFRARLRVRDSAKPVKVALVWTDTPATAFVTNPLVNDLNLEVARNYSTSAVYVGNSLQVTTEANGEESIAYSTSGTLPYDGVNNVEYFRLFMNPNEDFEVAVKAWNIAGDTDPDHSGFEQDFALAVVNADLLNNGQAIAPFLSAQTNAATTTSVNLSWTPAANMMITRYDIYRGTSLANMQVIGNTPFTFAINIGLAGNTAYVYKVVAVGPGSAATSNNDVATTIQWQAPVGTGTVVAAQHFTELRQGIDYVRTAAGLATNTWSQAITPSVIIRAAHMNELRDKLEEALSALAAPPPNYQFSDPIAGVSIIHVQDVTDLRNKVH